MGSYIIVPLINLTNKRFFRKPFINSHFSLGERVWILAQDEATCPTAKTTIKDIHGHGGEALLWPPASPDLNPMENVWYVLKDQVYTRNPKTERHLRDFILGKWNNLENDQIIKIVESFPGRLVKLREANGEYTGH